MPKRSTACTSWVNASRGVGLLAPFGGIEDSGLGRGNGLDAIHEYLEAKSVFVSPIPGQVPNPFVLRQATPHRRPSTARGLRRYFPA